MILYRFVDVQKACGCPVGRICDIAGVSTSAYYDWKQHRDGLPTIGELEERRLGKEITVIPAASDGTYGSPRVTGELGNRGWLVNHKRAERLMRIHNIVGYTPKKHRITTIPDAEHRIPDRVRRNFCPAAGDVTWCGDIFYIPTWEGFLYLGFVEDLASRRILGLSMATHLRADLVCDTLDAAVGTLVERTTRFTMLLHLPRMDGHGDKPRVKNGPALAGHGAEAVRDAIASLITTLPEQLRRSLTWDQGAEMAQHAQLRIDTGLAIYFCDPHSPWQRGTNENTNGLLRQYFPKGHRPV